MTYRIRSCLSQDQQRTIDTINTNGEKIVNFSIAGEHGTRYVFLVEDGLSKAESDARADAELFDQRAAVEKMLKEIVERISTEKNSSNQSGGSIS